jgi:hypothetical protein
LAASGTTTEHCLASKTTCEDQPTTRAAIEMTAQEKYQVLYTTTPLPAGEFWHAFSVMLRAPAALQPPLIFFNTEGFIRCIKHGTPLHDRFATVAKYYSELKDDQNG